MDHLPRVVSPEEWLSERKKFLQKEKDHMQARDRLNAERRQLPMVRIEKDYVFQGPDGPVKLLDLFQGRSQLLVHHYMFHPDDDAPCRNCCSSADTLDGQLRQVGARNTALVAVSRAPVAKLEAFGRRMGWRFPWYSSAGSDFNYDFHATLDSRVAPVLYALRSEAELADKGSPWDREKDDGGDAPGISAFLRVGDDVYHTYSTYGRGIEPFMSGYNYLDITALGRQEKWELPQGRAEPLEMHAGGRNILFPDEYKV